jgi:O-antigen/teichoic acid export membrane protein
VIARVNSLVRSRTVQVVGLLGVQALLAAAFAVLTARWLGPDDRGVIVIVTTLCSFLMLVGSFGAATGGRMLLSQEAADYTTRSHLGITRRLSGVHLLTMLVIGWPLLAVANAWRGWLVASVFALYGVSMVAIYLLREALHGVGLHSRATFADVLMNAVLVAGLLATQIVFTVTVLSVTWLLFVAAAAEVAFLVFHLVRVPSARETEHHRSMKALLLLSAPALLASLGQAFTIRGDRLVLGTMSDSHAVGIYGTAATFAEIMWLIPMGVGQIIFRHAAQGRFDQVKRLRTATLICMVVVGVFAAAIAKPAVAILLGPDYADSVPLIWLLLAASLPMGVYHLYAPMLNGAGDLKGPAIAGGFSSAVLLILCVATIPVWGAYGAGIASFFAYSLMAAVTVVRSRRLRTTSPDTKVHPLLEPLNGHRRDASKDDR